MEAEVQNDYLDDATNYTSEAHEQYVVPGFRHEVPKPTAVNLKIKLFNF